MTFESATDTHILRSREGRVGIIRLNRPKAMNALMPAMEAELHAALDDAIADPEVSVIILTGEGPAFCSGYDLDNDAKQAAPQTSAERLHRWWKKDLKSPDKHWHLMSLEKPVIAAVNGWCLGGGFWYALSADITIASDRAVFGQPEVRENQNSSILFAALVGWKNAHRYALTGDHFDAAEALRIGVVNEVVPHDALMERSLEFASRLALVPQDSLRVNKAITSFGMEAMGLRSAMNIAGALSVIAHASTDSNELDELNTIRSQEGMRASLKHRDGPFLPEPGGPRSKSG